MGMGVFQQKEPIGAAIFVPGIAGRKIAGMRLFRIMSHSRIIKNHKIPKGSQKLTTARAQAAQNHRVADCKPKDGSPTSIPGTTTGKTEGMMD